MTGKPMYHGSRSGGRTGNRPWKTVFKTVLTLLSIGAVVFHFVRNADDLSKVLNLSSGHLAVIALLQLAYQLVFTSRSVAVVRKCSNRSITWFQWFRISSTGRFLSLFVPQSGNVYQGVHLKRFFRVGYTEYLTSKFSLAWIDFIFNMLFAAAVIVAADYSFRLAGLPAPLVLLVIGVCVAVVPPVMLRLLRSADSRHRYVQWLRDRLTTLLEITLQSMRDTGYLARLIGLGLVIFSITCGVIYTCFDGLGAAPTVRAVVLFCALLKISDHAALTPGNLGVREILFGILGEFFGLGVSEGILVSVIRRVISQIEIAIIAGLVNVRSHRHREGETSAD